MVYLIFVYYQETLCNCQLLIYAEWHVWSMWLTLPSGIRLCCCSSVCLLALASFSRTFTFLKVIDCSWKSGVGATIGAGVYILIGTVAREQAGPALVISLLIAGIAAGLSAFCYAELACRCPSAGSAYHYTYICIGEG